MLMPGTIALPLAGWSLRPWRESDVASLVEHADDAEVWRTLSDRFPHPYTREIAEAWVRRGHLEFGGDQLAVCLDDIAVGGCGLAQGGGESRCNVEIGYWLGRAYWGCGVATDVVRALTVLAFERPEAMRMCAPVHAHNAASLRVLQKAGFVREGLLRQSTIKAGRVIDVELWACYRDAAPSAGATAARAETPLAFRVVDLHADGVEAVRLLLHANGWAHRIGSAQRFAALLAASQRTAVALSADRVVGFARAITDELSNGYLSMVVVAPQHRRRGIGRALVEHLMGDDPDITWLLHADRDGAAAFFARLGFIASATAMERRRSAIAT